MKEIEIVENYVEVGKILEFAEQNIRSDGYLVPVAFGFSAEQTFIFQITFKNDEEKCQQYFTLGSYLKRNSCFRFVLLNDVAMRQVEKENFKEVVKNYVTERPTAYPESMRQDAIVLQDYDFNKKTFVMYCKKYKKVGKDFKFEDVERFENMVSQMVKIVLKGFAE